MAEHRIVVPGVVGSTPITHPTFIMMTTPDKIYLGIDIGASSLKYGYGNCQLDLLHFSKVTLHVRSLSGMRDAIATLLKDVDQRLGIKKIAAIGVGTPGMVDIKSGKICGVNPNLPSWGIS